MDKLKILTINARGLQNNKKRHCVFTYLKKNKFDIVGIQERHVSSNKQAEQWELQWGGKLFYSLGTARRLGQIILVNKKMMQNAVLVYRDERILLIEIAITDKKIYIANVYAPQAKQDKIDIFAQVQHIMDSLDKKKNNKIKKNL